MDLLDIYEMEHFLKTSSTTSFYIRGFQYGVNWSDKVTGSYQLDAVLKRVVRLVVLFLNMTGKQTKHSVYRHDSLYRIDWSNGEFQELYLGGDTGRNTGLHE